MEKINVVLEQDKKDSTKVIGRVVNGTHKGKVAFFKGAIPKLGDGSVLAEKFVDRGRFILIESWVKNPGHSEEKIAKFLEERSRFPFAPLFAKMAGNAANESLALGLIIEIPLNGLEIALKGSVELMTAFEKYEATINKAANEGDVIAMSLYGLLQKARTIFSSGGGPEEFKKDALKEILELLDWIKWSRKNPGHKPTLGAR